MRERPEPAAFPIVHSGSKDSIELAGPFSEKPNFPASSELTGISRRSGLSRGEIAANGQLNQSITGDFPTRPNREIPRGLQGIRKSDQGNYPRYSRNSDSAAILDDNGSFKKPFRAHTGRKIRCFPDAIVSQSRTLTS
jgi:hypothetical protein